MAIAVPVPEHSFLSGYALRGAFTDCYAVEVDGVVTLPGLVRAFYTTPIFKLERWLLDRLLGLRSSDLAAEQLAKGETTSFSAWRVENRSTDQILLDAGQTRSWLSVAVDAQNQKTTLLFGSAVVPMRPGGKFGLAFHTLLGFHRLYSKLLLSAAKRRVIALRPARSAA
jgi:hypothetical protein